MPTDTGFDSKGHVDLFNDARVTWASTVLGPFEGMEILELGPLEGAHSCMMERLGAKSVIAIEANTRAFLKCLCVKEIFNLKNVSFKLGSFFPYLESCGRTDLIFASGVLYHMTEPLRLLELLCAKTDRLFIWTHYYDPDVIAARDDKMLFAAPKPIEHTSYRGSRKLYPNAALSWAGFSGGADSYAIWMERDSLERFFVEKGFKLEFGFEDKAHPNGPAFAFCASR